MGDIFEHTGELKRRMRAFDQPRLQVLGLRAVVEMFEQLEAASEEFEYAREALTLLARQEAPTGPECESHEQGILAAVADEEANEDDVALLQLLAWFRLGRLDDLVVTLERCVGAQGSLEEELASREMDRQLTDLRWAEEATPESVGEALRDSRRRAHVLSNR